MNAINLLLVLLLFAASLIYWLRQAHKQAKRDRRRWIEDAPEYAEMDERMRAAGGGDSTESTAAEVGVSIHAGLVPGTSGPDVKLQRAWTLLDLKNHDSLRAWQRRWIEAHPQTVVTQRFPSQQLQADIVACERAAPAWLRREDGPHVVFGDEQ